MGLDNTMATEQQTTTSQLGNTPLHTAVEEWFSRISMYRRKLSNLEVTPESVHSELLSHFQHIQKIAEQAPETRVAFENMQHPLIYFADEMMVSFSWSGQMQWSSSALQMTLFQQNIGGNDFYTRLDDLLDQSKPDPSLMKLYYKMLRMGFKGSYFGKELQIQSYEDRLRTFLKIRPEDRITPDAYLHTDPQDAVRMPVLGTLSFILTMIFVMMVLYFGVGFVEDWNWEELTDKTDSIINKTYDFSDNPDPGGQK
jgi:type IV/VI secretion system ImpK/VasF family protein